MRVYPLTRRRPDGAPLQRSPQVEAQIVGALALSPDELIQRATLRDSQTTEYLQEETLVYLIRAFHHLGNSVVVNTLSEELLRRCARLRIRNCAHLAKTKLRRLTGRLSVNSLSESSTSTLTVGTSFRSDLGWFLHASPSPFFAGIWHG
jgi:hypothetical protein